MNLRKEPLRDLPTNLRPLGCCELGTYMCTIPMPIAGKVQGVDYCISDIVAALNAANIKTIGSCCGHGKVLPFIHLENDAFLIPMNRKEVEKYDEVKE